MGGILQGMQEVVTPAAYRLGHNASAESAAVHRTDATELRAAHDSPASDSSAGRHDSRQRDCTATTK